MGVEPPSAAESGEGFRSVTPGVEGDEHERALFHLAQFIFKIGTRVIAPQ